MNSRLSPTLLLSIFLCFLFFTACIKRERGCIDKTALNFNPDAFISDSSCVYEFDTPGSYLFNRVGTSSVTYADITVQQALIYDYTDHIQQFGQQVITDSTTLASLYQYYQEPAPILDIRLQTTPYSLSESTYFRIDEDANSLEDDLSSFYNADSIIIASLDTIYANSLLPSKQGTPAVYMSQNKINLSTYIPLTLLGGVIFNEAVNILESIESYSSSTVVSNSNYTPQEHAWDRCFAYYGAAINLADYPSSQIAQGIPYQDFNNSGAIELDQEFNFHFVQSFAARDVVNESLGISGFNHQLFQAFLEGRTAISSKKDTLVFFRDSLLHHWEGAIAATVIHHLKQVQLEMQQLGSNNANLEQLGHQWAAMLCYLRMIGYLSQPRLQTNLNDLLDIVGQSPVSSSASSASNVEYRQQLDLLVSILQEQYQFSSAQIDGW